MKWNDLKIRTKLLLSFGLLLVLLAIVGLIASFGIGGIVKDADQVIAGNKLRGELETRYTQHLIWAKQVSEFLTSPEVTELHVQTDHHKCDFGKWYYGEGRQQAEELVPELKEILALFEKPHQELHQSALTIEELHQNVDIGLSIALNKAKADHLLWMLQVKDAILLQKGRLNVQMDHQLCGFGQWLSSTETTALLEKDSALKDYIDQLTAPHEKLHSSSRRLQSLVAAGDYAGALRYYQQNTAPSAEQVIATLDELITQNREQLEGTNAANSVFYKTTLLQLDTIGKLFQKAIDTSTANILSEDKMVSSARRLGTISLVILILSLVIGLFLAFYISGVLVSGIKKGVTFAKNVAEGDLSKKLEIAQKDEIGELADALNVMVDGISDLIAQIKKSSASLAGASTQMSTTSLNISSGANQQASSTEEVSASMEEMGSTIDQNKDYSIQCEQITSQMAQSIKEGSEASDENETLMRQIAEKVQLINEITQQTNILALNAAVEAARAGEHGRGFAVVASEVRKLAEKSKISAEDISILITEGVEVADKAGRKLRDALSEIDKTVKMVQEIAAASSEQSTGAQQVNQAIQELNLVTQANAAASEELASSSSEVERHAGELRDMVGSFKLN